MKKVLLAVALIGMVGCSNSSEPVEILPYYGMNLNLKSDLYSKYDLEHEYEFVAVETYGKVAFKAIYWCHNKFERELNGIDLSSDAGSYAIDDYNLKNELCVTQSLKLEKPILEAYRIKLERPNVGLELNESEVVSYNEAPVAEYDKNSPRYKEVLASCAANNNSIVDDQEFVEAVDFCVAKGM